jgi:selenocysteine lyase/cysteine desulfurase
MNSADGQPLGDQRELFDIPEGVTYLNCAYMSPLLRSVIEAGEAGVRLKRRPWEITVDSFFDPPDRARELFGGIIGASREDIAVVPSVSYGVAVAARNIPISAGQDIVLLKDQFPSNVYAWQEKAKAVGARIVTVPRPDPGTDWTSAILEATGSRTAVLSLPPCHWTDGSLIDLERVGAAAREVGAALVVDATQYAGAAAIDVGAFQPDFLIAAAYKWLLGPYALGFMYVSPRWQGGRPLEETWAGRQGSRDFSRLVDYRDEYMPGARRMDMGEGSQFHLMPMAIAAMEQILAWGVDRIAVTLGAKTRRMARKARELGLRSVPASLRADHFLGLLFPPGEAERLLPRLSERGIHVSVRGDSMRITPHLYNDLDDEERLFGVLKEELRRAV